MSLSGRIDALSTRLSAEIKLVRTETYVFSVTGPLAPATGKSRIYIEGAYKILSVRAAVNTAPAGSAVVVDVNKNGSTVFTTQANRPTVAAGMNTGSSVPAVIVLAVGDYLTVDLDSVGSTTAGSDLTVAIRLAKTG